MENSPERTFHPGWSSYRPHAHPVHPLISVWVPPPHANTILIAFEGDVRFRVLFLAGRTQRGRVAGRALGDAHFAGIRVVVGVTGRTNGCSRAQRRLAGRAFGDAQVARVEVVVGTAGRVERWRPLVGTFRYARLPGVLEVGAGRTLA